MAWELYTDNTLRTYPNWTGEAYDPNNLCSFNSNIQKQFHLNKDLQIKQQKVLSWYF